MIKARIYQPDKTAMQSGKAEMKHWVLEFAPEKPPVIDSLIGWTGMSDMPQEVILSFPTRDEAIAYAKRQKLTYEVFEPNQRHQIRKAYADNFKFGRPTG